MQTKKENLIDKIVKRDFNNELESVLEQKNFEENAKSTLLSILYKIEIAYKDIEVVKQDIYKKEEYLEKLISIIQDKCTSIKLVRMNSENINIPENSTFFVDKRKGQIESYPIERKLLYAVWKIGKKDKILKRDYFFLDMVISDLLTVGNTIDMVEPLRDFNGYSWATVSSEIESIWHNLIYQNLRILIGNQYLNDWIYSKETSKDYYATFLENFTKQYGKEKANKINDLLIKISILLEMKFEPKKLEPYRKNKKTIERDLERMQNKQLYVETITRKKSELTTHIKYLDTILNDKRLLEKEYIKRNSELTLDKKIFSMKVLSKILIEEREKDCEKIEELNNILNPKNFVLYKKELEEKYKYFSILDIKEQDIEKTLKKEIIQFQKNFLSCLANKVKKIGNKQQIISLIYQFRYYYQLPITREKQINQEIPQKDLKIAMSKLLNKAVELKAIQKISQYDDYIYEIWRNIFSARVIKLENVSIKLTKEKEQYFLQIFDEDMFEEKIPIEILIQDGKKLDIKLNKKTKIFE